jgi:uncharacterized protein (TIGR00251 family)
MASKRYNFHDGKKGSALAIRVVPGASKNEIAEVLEDGTLRIRLTAPPVEGKANKALVDFLSNWLNVPRSKIAIVAGEKRHDKLVSILDIDSEVLQQRIANFKA